MANAYSNAAAFRQALEARLRTVAEQRGVQLQGLRLKVAIERLLARLFSAASPPWLLKGGYTHIWTDRENKRSKDLVDLVVLIERGNLDPEAVQQALIETFRRRKRHPLPSNLQPPPASWAREFPSMAAEAGASTLDVNSAFKALDGFWRKHGLGASEPVSR